MTPVEYKVGVDSRRLGCRQAWVNRAIGNAAAASLTLRRWTGVAQHNQDTMRGGN